MAASLTCSGVPKSGSPADKLIISLPSDLNLFARADIVIVAEEFIFKTEFDRDNIIYLFEFDIYVSYASDINHSRK